VKILFVSGRHCDWLASTIYLGLIGRYGRRNVFDATGGDRSMTGMPCFTEPTLDDERGFDLLVINACFRANHDWHFILGHCGVSSKGEPNARLKKTCKIAYVDGWDLAHEFYAPPFAVDGVFRREIDPTLIYPYTPHWLGFGAPKRWYRDADNERRPIDVFFGGSERSHPIRWETCREVFKANRHTAVISLHTEGYSLPPEHYFEYLSRSKIGLCPLGGGGCEAVRTYETAAAGAIPLFVGKVLHDNQEGWFTPGFDCLYSHTADGVPHLLDTCLNSPEGMKALRENVLVTAKRHTVRARVNKMLRILGVEE